MDWALRPTRWADVRYVAANMREIDRLECKAMGRDPKRSLYLGLKSSQWCLTALYRGRPAAIFGVRINSMIGSEGVPWMLCTPDAERGAKALLTLGPDLVGAMHDEARYLSNYVGAENRRAIRLLQALGFTVEAETVIIGDMPMRLFWRRG